MHMSPPCISTGVLKNSFLLTFGLGSILDFFVGSSFPVLCFLFFPTCSSSSVKNEIKQHDVSVNVEDSHWIHGLCASKIQFSGHIGSNMEA